MKAAVEARRRAAAEARKAEEISRAAAEARREAAEARVAAEVARREAAEARKAEEAKAAMLRAGVKRAIEEARQAAVEARLEETRGWPVSSLPRRRLIGASWLGRRRRGRRLANPRQRQREQLPGRQRPRKPWRRPWPGEQPSHTQPTATILSLLPAAAAAFTQTTIPMRPLLQTAALGRQRPWCRRTPCFSAELHVSAVRTQHPRTQREGMTRPQVTLVWQDLTSCWGPSARIHLCRPFSDTSR